MVALALHRFGIAIIDAQNIAHPCLYTADERIPPVEVTAVAGTKTGLLGAFVQRRRNCLGVDLVDQPLAIAKAQKPLIDVYLNVRVLDELD